MTEIILIRHGETAWNVDEIFRGRIDVELNETGTKQAELLAEYLSKVRIEAIYSSPLKRALKTAEIIAGYHKLDVDIASSLRADIIVDFPSLIFLPSQPINMATAVTPKPRMHMAKSRNHSIHTALRRMD